MQITILNLHLKKYHGNVVHFAHYAISLVTKDDSLELKKAYDKAKFKDELHDEIFLTAMADIINKDDSNFALDDFEFSSLSNNDNLKEIIIHSKLARMI